MFDAGVDEATQMPFLVMELLKGEELGKRLERLGRFSPPDTVTYLWQTALALDKTHRANIVHRDLKPENLFLTQREDGPPRVKVLDFGVAKFVAETGTSGPTRSLGTPLYMSPEQFRSQRVSPASDIFALALMAYTLLVGEAYWQPEASGDVDVIAFALATAAGPKEPATVRAARLGVILPPAFDAWFSASTQADPTLRTTTATACITALGEVFGLSPSRMTGLASSDPRLVGRSGATLPHGSPVPAGGGTILVESRPSMPVLGAGPIAGQTGTGAVTYTGAGARSPRPLPALAVLGAVVIAGVVGVGLYLNRGPASAGQASADPVTTPSAPVLASASAPVPPAAVQAASPPGTAAAAVPTASAAPPPKTTAGVTRTPPRPAAAPAPPRPTARGNGYSQD